MKDGQNICIKKVKNGFMVTPVPDVNENPNRNFPEDSVLVFLSCNELIDFIKKHFSERPK